MSLLMKALANAEENKRILVEKAQEQNNERQQAAANIFTASKNSPASFSMLLNGLIGLIILGIFWFSYKLYQLNQIPSNLTINSLPATQSPSAQGTLKQTPQVSKSVVKVAQHIEQTVVAKQTNPISNNDTLISKTQNKVAKKTTPLKSKVVAPVPPKAEVTGKIDTLSRTQDLQPVATSNTQNENLSNKSYTSPTQIKVEHKAGDVVLDQRLENAYHAFVSGDTTKAKSLYRSVLKQDVYQTDALLGMAAIAQKQGRFADATGWYQKALASEPNNPVALAGLAATSPTADAGYQELRLKKLISKQPYHAQHYANLGNLYASQQSWTKAQAAFFEANRHDKNNAQFAFNLAISLEHMGKPSLAVQHYERALELVRSQQLSVPNSAQIQQRLDVLQ